MQPARIYPCTKPPLTDRPTGPSPADSEPASGRVPASPPPPPPPGPPAASGACPSDWLSDWSSPPGRQPPAALLSSQRTSDRVTDSRPSSLPAASPGQLFKPLSSAPLCSYRQQRWPAAPDLNTSTPGIRRTEIKPR